MTQLRQTVDGARAEVDELRARSEADGKRALSLMTEARRDREVESARAAVDEALAKTVAEARELRSRSEIEKQRSQAARDEVREDVTFQSARTLACDRAKISILDQILAGTMTAAQGRERVAEACRQ